MMLRMYNVRMRMSMVRRSKQTRSRQIRRVSLMIRVSTSCSQVRRCEAKNFLNCECGRSIRCRRNLLRIVMMMRMRLMHLLLLMSQIHDTMWEREVNQLIISLLTFVSKKKRKRDERNTTNNENTEEKQRN
jgi:hypothetical protein